MTLSIETGLTGIRPNISRQVGMVIIDTGINDRHNDTV